PLPACGSIGLQPIASDTAFPPREKNAPPALPPKRLPVAIGPYEPSMHHVIPRDTRNRKPARAGNRLELSLIVRITSIRIAYICSASNCNDNHYKLCFSLLPYVAWNWVRSASVARTTNEENHGAHHGIRYYPSRWRAVAGLQHECAGKTAPGPSARPPRRRRDRGRFSDRFGRRFRGRAGNCGSRSPADYRGSRPCLHSRHRACLAGAQERSPSPHSRVPGDLRHSFAVQTEDYASAVPGAGARFGTP